MDLVLTKLPFYPGLYRQCNNPLPALEPEDCRCEECKGMPLVDPEDQQPDLNHWEGKLSIVQENREMRDLDHDVLSITLHSRKMDMPLQVYAGTMVDQLVEHYAKAKKVAKHKIMPYLRADPSAELQDAQKFFMQMKAARGGTSIFVKHYAEWLEVPIMATTTAGMVTAQLNTDLSLIYKGARVDDRVVLLQLTQSDFELGVPPTEAVLRPLPECMASFVIHLVELGEWFAQQDEGPLCHGCRHSSIDLALLRWRRAVITTEFYRGNAYRGGAPKRASLGRMPWESTRTITGPVLAVKISAGDKEVPQIAVDEVTTGAFGVALALMSSWTKLQAVESEHPLLILLPGKCSNTLKRLGVSPGCCSEFEMLLREPLEQKVIKRNVTAIALSDHAFKYGSDMAEVSWTPQSHDGFGLGTRREVGIHYDSSSCG